MTASSRSLTLNVTAPADGKGKLTFSGLVGPAAGWLDGFELRLKNAAGSSNPFLIGLAVAPVVLDNGNNDTADTAQAVTLPCEIAGRDREAPRPRLVLLRRQEGRGLLHPA